MIASDDDFGKFTFMLQDELFLKITRFILRHLSVASKVRAKNHETWSR